MMVLEGGAFEKYLNHEGGALTNGVGALRNLRTSTSLQSCDYIARRGQP